MPEHIVPLLTVIVGVGLTITELIAVLLDTQPCALMPVIEYAVLDEGVTMFVPLE